MSDGLIPTLSFPEMRKMESEVTVIGVKMPSFRIMIPTADMDAFTKFFALFTHGPGVNVSFLYGWRCEDPAISKGATDVATV